MTAPVNPFSLPTPEPAVARALLMAARNWLDRPQKWCQRTLARNHKGEAVRPLDATADQWDIEGALVLMADRIGFEHQLPLAYAALREIATHRKHVGSRGQGVISLLNDESTWELALDALDEASSLLREVHPPPPRRIAA